MSGSVLLGVADLSVQAGARVLLREVSFSLHAGECLTLLGESGAGKSLLAQAVMGTLAPSLRASGRVIIEDASTAAADGAARRPRWGRALALLPQEPALALDPLMRIERQLAEVHSSVRGVKPARAARAQAREGLDAAGLRAAADRYPWQLSGGMAQRAAAAIALAGGAHVLIADEPTKGLDAHWRDRTVALLADVAAQGGCVIVITHDLRVAKALGGRIIVLREGDVVEAGDAAEVLARPRHDFTRQLIEADPAHWPRRAEAGIGEVVLCAHGIAKDYGRGPLFDGLDVTLARGERLVLQGPSGAGKSTLGNVLLGLVPADRGRVERGAGLPPFAMQKLYQDPVGSFPAHAALGDVLRDVATLHARPWPAMVRRLEELRVPGELLERRPAQVSGGELQRVALARVLAVDPAVVVADEPTSRLDPLSQREAIQVLLSAVEASQAALVLVTHDVDIARALATRTLEFDDGGLVLAGGAQRSSEIA